jgi:hypothetical protein
MVLTPQGLPSLFLRYTFYPDAGTTEVISVLSGVSSSTSFSWNPNVLHLSVGNLVNMSGHRRSSTETYIQSSSGDTQTWPILDGWGVTERSRTQVVQNDVFICSGGVDVGRLLRLSRHSLYKKALAVGDSSVTPDKRIVLVNERYVLFLTIVSC